MTRVRSQVKNTTSAPSAGWLGPQVQGVELSACGQCDAGSPEPAGGGRASAAATHVRWLEVRGTPVAAARRAQSGGQTATAVTNRYIRGRRRCHSPTLRAAALRLMCALARTMLQCPAGPPVYAAHDAEA